MIAIVLEDDQHSRAVIESMLGKLGYGTVLHAANFNELGFFIEQNRERISLILVALGAAEGLDLPVSRQVIQHRSLDLVPLVLMEDPWLLPYLIQLQSRHSRIDDRISRPFGIRDLQRSIVRGRYRRACLRSTLLVGGKLRAVEAAGAVFASRDEAHWRTVVPVDHAADFDAVLLEAGFRVGGILLEPGNVDEELLDRIARFKKTALGIVTPIGTLGQGAELIRELRPHCEVFFDPPVSHDPISWGYILTSFSRRLAGDGQAKDLLQAGRYALKDFDLATAAKQVRAALRSDENRWEFLELAGLLAEQEGRVAEACELFNEALRTNPCSPLSYLRLLELTAGTTRRGVAERAKAYCPAHPQVAELITELKDYK